MNNIVSEDNDNKKDTILERLNKRHKDRQNFLEVKLEQRNKENVQLEGVDFFAQTFAERLHDIQQRLNVVSAPTTQLFSEITVEIQELQRYLTASTMFLSDYKIKACQQALNELQSSAEETRVRLLPKKKFGFSGKKVTPKVALNPKVSADALDAAQKAAGDSAARTAAFSWTLAQKEHAYIMLSGAEVDSKDLTISQLNHCFVELQGHPSSLQISHVSDCFILCGPLTTSVFAEYCKRVTLVVACQQLRLHSSTECRLYMQVTCRAIIEDCSDIAVAPYNYNYDHIEQDYERAKLDRQLNNYTDVADFNWLSPDAHSPNWYIMREQLAPDWPEVRKEFKLKL